MTSLVTLFDHKLQFFKKSPNWPIFTTVGAFFKKSLKSIDCSFWDVKWDFFCDLQTLWSGRIDCISVLYLITLLFLFTFESVFASKICELFWRALLKNHEKSFLISKYSHLHGEKQLKNQLQILVDEI